MGVLPAAVEMASASKVPDLAESPNNNRTVQMTFVDSYVSSVSEDDVFALEVQMNDVPRELLYHI